MIYTFKKMLKFEHGMLDFGRTLLFSLKFPNSRTLSSTKAIPVEVGVLPLVTFHSASKETINNQLSQLVNRKLTITK